MDEASAADAISALKKKKKQQKRDSANAGTKKGGGLGGGLGDMLSALPSSKTYKKQQKHQKPNSDTISVPAIPTQNSIRERSGLMSTSIKDRMSNFKGAGGPPAYKTSSTHGRTSVVSGGPSYRNSTGMAAVSKFQAAGVSTAEEPVSKRASTGTTPPKKMTMGSSSLQEYSSRRGQNGTETSKNDDGDLLAGESARKVKRRNSLDGNKKPQLPGNAPRGGLRDRMKLFEKNIEGNKQAGTAKKPLW